MASTVGGREEEEMGVSAVSATGCLLLCDKLCLSLAGQVEPDGRGVEKRMDALCE